MWSGLDIWLNMKFDHFTVSLYFSIFLWLYQMLVPFLFLLSHTNAFVLVLFFAERNECFSQWVTNFESKRTNHIVIRNLFSVGLTKRFIVHPLLCLFGKKGPPCLLPVDRHSAIKINKRNTSNILHFSTVMRVTP